MIKTLRLLFFVPLFQLAAVAQQLVFPGYNYHSPSPYYYTCFADRYSFSYGQLVSMSDTRLYRANRVKKVLVYSASADDRLLFSFELDTAGKVWRYGRLDHYFAVSGEIKADNWDYVDAVSYYEQSILVRSDTTFVKYQDYKNKDTTIHFAKTKKRVYKIGYLVNEQNSYYNEKFYNVHYKENSLFHPVPIFVVTANGQIIPPDPNSDILLRKKLKTDHDSNRLYCCSETNYSDNVHASGDNGKTELPVGKLRKHRFYKNFYAKFSEKYFVSGESFWEPPEYHMAMSCGNYVYYQQREMEESRHYSFEIKYNDKGLYDTYYQLYYPVDTSAARKDAAKQKKDSSNQNSLRLTLPTNFWQFPGFYSPRSAIPVKTPMYYIRYEYFEAL